MHLEEVHMSKFIWLFGENNSRTHDNNSYCLWEQIALKNDNINKFYVLLKNKENKAFVKTLPKAYRRLIVWRNSLKHIKLYTKADMFFVSLSYDDITPSKILGKKIKFKTKRPVIYLQHGTLAIKQIGYSGVTYNNNMFRFVMYNKNLMGQFAAINNFKPYQLYYGEYHPRYRRLLQKRNTYTGDSNQILFFMTWREYFGNNLQTKKLIKKINRFLSDEKLGTYLEKTGTKLVLALHQFFDETQIDLLKQNITSDHIVFVPTSKMDIMDELIKSHVLITDYSSLGFDFTFLNKPVILFQPDLEDYLQHRKLYCEIEELQDCAIQKADRLVDLIIRENYEINEFFKTRLPEKIDYDYVLRGGHIEKMYAYFKKLQENRITMIGYNFTGRGGTVNATKALAEALLEKDYLVELLSLKMTEPTYTLPYGLSLTSFYNRKQNIWKNRFKRYFFRSKKDFYYFKYDINKSLLFPYIGRALRKYLENCNSRTVISTRESVHLFVKNFAGEQVLNKIYFFHTDSAVLEQYYPGLMNEIKKTELENCVFVTKSSHDAYMNNLHYTQYKNYAIVGNSLDSNAMIERKFVKINRTREDFYAVTLIRLSKDRKNDVDNMIRFGKYLVDHKITGIRVHIYGSGDLENYLIDQILDYDLEDVLLYLGPTNTPKNAILANDCLVDFCDNQSFGMTYLEGVLNGKPVFSKENAGSLEVLRDIPDAYYHSDEELASKIMGIRKKRVREYKRYYDIIWKTYSREHAAEQILPLLDK